MTRPAGAAALQMLPAPALFYKWKERHLVRFSFSAGGVALQLPAPFTLCVQEIAVGGSPPTCAAAWVFPSSETEEVLLCRKASREGQDTA